jgi:hypothetical protein
MPNGKGVDFLSMSSCIITLILTIPTELDPEDPNRNPPPRKPGRPKGSKDGPRYLDAPKRGRPKDTSEPLAADTADRGPSTVDNGEFGHTMYAHF